ncbi:hypothetical protein L1049_001059 [Liquidambar formosana]|uniref:Aminotransferase-like plant mobile domain-containing protein n=1 Tax=Liquidambar formosana TaxID=63359 RepID=A0AAP0NDJ5_LIQFO
MVEMMEKLIESYRQIKRTTGQLPGHYTWMDHFMGCRLELEHEAFLALWLSRYVFPANLYETIGKHLFPIAIRLARGIPIALAPAVLASLYRDLEFESFARCLRVCELVGLDCIEQYLPHRVAMQFGLDQDIPDRVCRSNETPEIAWSNYNRPIGDTKLYVPPRLFESDVTTRYSRWWKLSLAWQDVNKGIVRQRRSSRQLPRDSKRKKEAEDSVNEDKLTLSELLTSNGKLNDMGRRLVSDVKPSLGIQARTLSCTASSVMIREEKFLMEPVEKIMQSEALVGGAEKATEDANENQAKSPVNDTLNINDYNGASSSCGTTEVPGRELEARISNLEKVTARLRTKHD